MCLLLLAFDPAAERPWLLLGNRDEFHARPTAPAGLWNDTPGIIGGRDLEAGGSWLAVHRNGRFAAVTNVRNGRGQRGVRSRGELVAGFVTGASAPLDYAADVAGARDQYGPFNLIVGDRHAAAGASSTLAQAWRFEPGIHVLSNGPPGSAWPKARRLKDAFVTLVQGGEMQSGRELPRSGAWPDDARLLDALADSTGASDDDLPETGVGIELERLLAPVFIRGSQYGTRASTLAYTRADGACVLVERGFGPDGVALGEARIET
jgi:uncharacterized protein with NRDE domain